MSNPSGLWLLGVGGGTRVDSLLPDAEAGLVVWGIADTVPLGAATTIPDSSGNSVPITLSGDSTVSPECQAAVANGHRGLSFDAGETICFLANAAAVLAAMNAGAFTIFHVVKWDTVGGTPATLYFALWGGQWDADSSYIFADGNRDSNVGAERYDDGTGDWQNLNGALPSTADALLIVYRAAVDYLEVRVNGVSIATNTDPWTMGALETFALIGYEGPDYGSGAWNGWFLEAGIWDHFLTDPVLAAIEAGLMAKYGISA